MPAYSGETIVSRNTYVALWTEKRSLTVTSRELSETVHWNTTTLSKCKEEDVTSRLRLQLTYLLVRFSRIVCIVHTRNKGTTNLYFRQFLLWLAFISLVYRLVID